ncbi:MAG: hypothetical protein QF921_15215 [Pseudomonadales bacterium]|nr:hypothetical protein [Pseudomonadales bacterium]MDP6470951.1 hypothetical protein [Pseudomonadales bacterium]MDP6825864.1 hypothetical protein [Pseudomonadales bacterium]MDP6972832.1 hypothetical protein [Pseudomonadales bacterium]
MTYICDTIGWGNFGSLPAEKLGSFLERTFAPLAFLWLVIGYFAQQKELEQNTQALREQAQEIRRSAEQAVIQSEQMAASEPHARQQAFLQITNTLSSQLGTIAVFLYLSSHDASGNQKVSDIDISRLFTQMSASDPEIFSRRLLEAHLQLGDAAEQLALFYGPTVRARHTNNFIATFERLLRRASEVDSEQMIHDALMTSGHGLIYRIAKRHQDNAPPKLADENITGTSFTF